jgi:hypothetical protein
VSAADEPRVARFTGRRPLCAGDLRTIARNLDHYGYPDECPVEIITPLPPRDRRIVDIVVTHQPQGEGL